MVGTTGQAYATGLRFVQFYFGLPLAMIILSLTVVPFFHRAKVYTAYEYLERRFDVRTRSLASFLFLMGRAFSLGVTLAAPAVVMSTILGLAAAGDGAGHLRADDRLHDDRRRAGGRVDRRQADVHRRRRDVGRRGHSALRHPAARQLRPGAAAGGRDRPAEGDRLQVRPARDLHVLVGDDRRAVPDAVVLRLRSEPGAAVPDGEVDRRGAAVAADERLREDSAAAADPDERRAGVRLLPVSDAADALQPHVRRAGGGEPAGRRVRRARTGVRRRDRREARRGHGATIARPFSPATRGSKTFALRRRRL